MKFRFFSLCMTAAVFAFFQIYHHNAVIRLRYQRQRLDREQGALLRQRNACAIELASLKNHELLQAKAVGAGMVPLSLTRVITYTGLTP